MGPDVRGYDAAAAWLAKGRARSTSSARLERYLQLCAEQNNMVVCVPSTRRRLHHMLRRQAPCADASSAGGDVAEIAAASPAGGFPTLDELANGSSRAIGEIRRAGPQSRKTRGNVFCKVYYDLLNNVAKRPERCRYQHRTALSVPA